MGPEGAITGNHRRKQVKKGAHSKNAVRGICTQSINFGLEIGDPTTVVCIVASLPGNCR